MAIRIIDKFGNVKTSISGGGSLPSDIATETTLLTLLKPADTLNAIDHIVDPVIITDGGGSITVDGALSISPSPGVDIGDVTVNNTAGAGAVNIQDGGNSITVDGPLTDAQLRAVPIPISGSITTSPSGTQDVDIIANSIGLATETTLSNIETLLTNPLDVDTGLLQGLTDTQLRATPVPVDTGLVFTPGLTDAELRAADVDVNVTNPSTNYALETGGNLADINSKLNTLGQKVKATSVPVVLASDSDPLVVSVGATDNTTLYSNTLTVTGAISEILTTGYSTIAIQLTGTWIGTLVVEGSTNNTDWDKLFIRNIDEVGITDFVYSNGNYVLTPSTKYFRLNVNQLQSGSVTVLIVGKTSSSLNAVDALSLAMDKSNNAPIYTEDIAGALKRDVDKALIPSDSPVTYSFNGISTTNSPIITVDTTGYQSISVQILSLSTSPTAYTSVDGLTWNLAYGVMSSSGGTFTSLSSTGTYSFPAIGKYFRLLANGNTAISVRLTLRQQPFVPFTSVGVVNNVQYVGGSTVTSGGNTSTGAVTNLIALQIGAPTTSSIGSTTVPYPIVIGGRDTPVTGAAAGKVRTLLLDGDGKVMLAGLPAATSSVNMTSVPVQDVTLFEGQTLIEIMAQILLELKIANQYNFESPNVLRQVLHDTTRNVGGFGNEPQEFRNELNAF